MMDAKAGPTPAAQIQSALDEAERVNIAEGRLRVRNRSVQQRAAGT